MSASLAFVWMDSFARIPDTPSGRANGRTHGVAVSGDGNVIVFHQAENALLTFDAGGALLSAVGGDRWIGAHGLTLVREGGTEYLWLTDQASGEVVKVTLQGETVQTLVVLSTQNQNLRQRSQNFEFSGINCRVLN